jgi:competence protein ComEA
MSEINFSFENFFLKYRYYFLLFLTGLIFIGLGTFLLKEKLNFTSTKVEILETNNIKDTSEIVVEIAGEVEKPGVYKLEKDARVEDLLIAAGGISSAADREWIERSLNRAAKLLDGQKIFIPVVGQQSSAQSAKNSEGYQSISPNFPTQGSGLVNINTATLSELDKLPGIGPVYGQNIIDHRPYSNIEELVSKGALKKYVFDKIKDKITIY